MGWPGGENKRLVFHAGARPAGLWSAAARNSSAKHAVHVAPIALPLVSCIAQPRLALRSLVANQGTLANTNPLSNPSPILPSPPPFSPFYPIHLHTQRAKCSSWPTRPVTHSHPGRHRSAQARCTDCPDLAPISPLPTLPPPPLPQSTPLHLELSKLTTDRSHTRGKSSKNSPAGTAPHIRSGRAPHAATPRSAPARARTARTAWTAPGSAAASSARSPPSPSYARPSESAADLDSLAASSSFSSPTPPTRPRTARIARTRFSEQYPRSAAAEQVALTAQGDDSEYADANTRVDAFDEHVAWGARPFFGRVSGASRASLLASEMLEWDNDLLLLDADADAEAEAEGDDDGNGFASEWATPEPGRAPDRRPRTAHRTRTRFSTQYPRASSSRLSTSTALSTSLSSK